MRRGTGSISKSFVIATPGLIVSACAVRTDNTSIIQAQTVAPPPPRPAANGPRIVNKMVASGTTTMIEGYIAMKSDCTALDTTVHVTQPPAHGTAVVTEGSDYPHYPPANPRSACNGTQVPWKYVQYTPTPGFTGSDVVTLDFFSKNGDSAEEKVLITVK